MKRTRRLSLSIDPTKGTTPSDGKPRHSIDFPGETKVNSSKLVRVTVAVTLAAGSCVALAANRPVALQSNQLPEIQCSTTQCKLVPRTAPRFRAYNLTASPMATPPAAPDPTPAVVGPPAGQRYMWWGPDAQSGACQEIKGVTPSNPYTYIGTTNLPVPLGSTHISLLATVEANLSGGPIGAAGDVGILEAKRSSSSNWYVVNAGFIYTVPGVTNPQSLFNVGTLHGLVSLADLPDPGTTPVPDMIDVRVIVYPIYVGGFTNVVYNEVCFGQLQLSF